MKGFARDMEITENKIRQYLLGSLATEEAEKIDLQIISDKNLEENLYLAEERLMEDYLEKTLSISERELFHENFLTSSERKSELKLLSLLKTYAQKKLDQPSETSYPEVRIRTNLFQKLKVLFGVNFPLITAVAVLLVLGLIVSVFFYDWTEGEIAEINQNELSDITEYKDLSNLNLISGVFRDVPAAGKLTKERLTDNVLIRLSLPGETASGVFFNIQIKDEQKTVASVKHVRSYKNPNGVELRLLLPSSLLKKGNYKIEAVPENADGALFIYTFTIQ